VWTLAVVLRDMLHKDFFLSQVPIEYFYFLCNFTWIHMDLWNVGSTKKAWAKWNARNKNSQKHMSNFTLLIKVICSFWRQDSIWIKMKFLFSQFMLWCFSSKIQTQTHSKNYFSTDFEMLFHLLHLEKTKFMSKVFIDLSCYLSIFRSTFSI
jgi:hypothetical protein